jgi:hypothetical protein
LVAIKYPEGFDTLLRKNSGELCRLLRGRLQELFQDDLLDWAEANLAEVEKRLGARHAVAHSIWTAADRSEMVSVQLLASLRSQQELDKLLRERGAAAEWETLHPKAGGPGPQTAEDLEKVRVGLEDAATWLEGARFRLASALFAGSPPGARQVLDPRDFT